MDPIRRLRWGGMQSVGPMEHERSLLPALSLQDLYVYISEHEHFTDFNVSSALFWQKRDLVYGDWTSGDNADGCYEHYGEVDISQVGPIRPR